MNTIAGRWRARSIVALAVLALVPAWALASPAAAAQNPNQSIVDHGNLLTNGGFEQPAAGGRQPAGWTADTQTPSSSLTWDRRVSHSGRASVRIDSPAVADVWWIQTVPVTANTAYLLTGWIKASNVARSPEGLDAGANVSFLGSFDRSVAVTGTSGWTQVAVTVLSGDQTQLTVAARLGFWGGVTTGTAWFDDFRLIALTNERVVNGGFQLGSPLPGALPAFWSPIAAESTAVFTWDRAVFHGAGRSVRIAAAGPNDAMWAQMVRVRPDTTYELSGWIRTSDVAHSTELVDAGANLAFLGTWDRSPGVYGTQDWTHVSVTTNSGSQSYLTVAARLGFWSGETTGTVWFDGLQLREVDE